MQIIMVRESFNNKLGIDNDDKKIIEMIEANPDITHSEIAEEVGKSQPAIGARILKLERKHLLTKQVGLNLKKVQMDVALVQIATRDVEEVIKKVEGCPFINYVFRVSGEYNLMIIIAADRLEVIERVVDICLREDPNVINVKTNFIITSERDFVIPIDFRIEKFDGNSCGANCYLSKNRPQFKFKKD
jgi:Lrp/AsnC family leucine-responsive transcriptional regulator